MDVYFFYYPGYKNDTTLIPYEMYLVIKSIFENKLIANIGYDRCIMCPKNTYKNCDNVFFCYICQERIKPKAIKHIIDIATKKMVLIYSVLKHYIVIDVIKYIINIPLLKKEPSPFLNT